MSGAGGQPPVLFRREGSVAWLVLNRPESRNALDIPMRFALRDAVADIAGDPSVRAVVLTGAGKAFCAGGDLASMRSLRSSKEAHDRLTTLHDIQREFLRLRKPVIGAINGHAVGAGLGLALGCDLLIAAESARFIPAFFRVGLVPDNGLLYWLPRMIGPVRTWQFLASDRGWTAHEARAAGLVAEVTAPDELEGVAREWANRFAEGPPVALALTKGLLYRTFDTDLDGLLAMEAGAQAVAMTSDDFKEGLQAFFEKREPKFQGT